MSVSEQQLASELKKKSKDEFNSIVFIRLQPKVNHLTVILVVQKFKMYSILSSINIKLYSLVYKFNYFILSYISNNL